MKYWNTQRVLLHNCLIAHSFNRERELQIRSNDGMAFICQPNRRWYLVKVLLPIWFDSQLILTNICNVSFQIQLLFREELTTLSEQNPEKFKLWFTIDRSVKANWPFSIGFISSEMVSEHLPVGGNCSDVAIFMCGPPPMINFACTPSLDKLGFPPSRRFTFWFI